MSSDITSTKDLIGADAPYTDKEYYVKSKGTEFKDSNMKKAIKQNDNKYKVIDTEIDLSNYDVFKIKSYLDKIRDKVSGINLFNSNTSGGKKSKKQRKSKKSKTTKKRKSRRRG